MIKDFKISIFPVLSPRFFKTDYCGISFENILPEFKHLDLKTFSGLENYVERILRLNNSTVAEGGYGENRELYNSSEHFNPTNEEPRTIHLGIDLWTKAGTPIFAPLDGKIHSQQYNGKNLDYGATIITEHLVEGEKFYILFGHLSLASLENRKVGENFKASEQLGGLGISSENGGWNPHLHLQIINDIGDWVGDYPGVAKKSEAKFYLKNSSNPYFLIHPETRKN